MEKSYALSEKQRRPVYIFLSLTLLVFALSLNKDLDSALLMESVCAYHLFPCLHCPLRKMKVNYCQMCRRQMSFCVLFDWNDYVKDIWLTVAWAQQSEKCCGVFEAGYLYPKESKSIWLSKRPNMYLDWVFIRLESLENPNGTAK